MSFLHAALHQDPGNDREVRELETTLEGSLPTE